MNIYNELRDIVCNIKELFFPAKCDLCSALVDSEGLCTKCWTNISWISEPKCKICGNPFDVNVDAICASCSAEKPHFDNAASVFRYDDFSRGIILKFKHLDATHMAKRLASWMYRAAEREVQHADVITTVPIHMWKRIRRKYNQSELLASEISKISGVHYEPRILEKTKNTKQQEGLSRKHRMKNVVGSFGINEKYKNFVKNKNIILVDDVFTTGATVNECSAILKMHEAKNVTVVTIAKDVINNGL
jgi:ComF family protein